LAVQSVPLLTLSRGTDRVTTDISTKERLLEAAEKLFSRDGFDGVSIRDLAAAAGVNVAAVNYHFGSKENLHHQVLERLLIPKRERLVAAIERTSAESDGRPSLEDLIRAFVSHHLHDALAHPDGEHLLRLMAALLADPRHGGDVLFRELILPVHRVFHAALLRAEPRLDSRQATWIIGSMVGQLLHFIMRRTHAHAVLRELDDPAEAARYFPAMEMAIEDYIEHIAAHVTRFSTGGALAVASGD
jgi:AcrR family transcriptional regulator